VLDGLAALEESGSTRMAQPAWYTRGAGGLVLEAAHGDARRALRIPTGVAC